MIKLYDHQKKGIKKANEKDKFALFMGVGTGKTFTALEIAKNKEVKKLLIITTSKIENSKQWIQAIEEIKFRGEFDVTTFDKCRTQKVTKIYEMIIVDESHKIKSSTSKNAKEIKKLCKKTKYVLGLTGTYASNNYVDTFCMLNNLDISILPHKNKNLFINEFYNFYEIPTAYGSVKNPLDLKKEKKSELLNLIDNYSFTYFEEEFKYNKSEKFVDVEMNEKQKKYQEELFKNILNDENINVLQKINYLQQVANGFIYDDEKNAVDLSNNKIKCLKKILKDNKNDKIILVYKYIYDLDKINGLELPENLIKLQVSQSEGLNLQNYNHIIFYAVNYSAKDFEQMKGRIDRIGQNQDIKYTYLVSKNSIDLDIFKSLKNKKTSSELLINFTKGKKWKQDID